jgi:hypothetical protein
MRDVPFSTRALENVDPAMLSSREQQRVAVVGVHRPLTSTQKQSLLPPGRTGRCRSERRGVWQQFAHKQRDGGPGRECSPEFINTTSGSVVPKSPGEVD